MTVENEMKTRSALEDAKAFLNAELARGPVAASQVLSDGHEQGIAERTLRRAQGKVGVIVRRVGLKGKKGSGYFTWQLKVLDSQVTAEVGSKDAAEFDDPPKQPCGVCGSIEFWRVPAGEWHCAKCFRKPYFALLNLWTVRRE